MSSHRPHLYAMLYVDDRGERPVNLSACLPDPLAVYLLNAVNLAASAAAAGMAFALITNAPERIGQALATQGLSDRLDLVPHTFALEVPHGIAFRSAHFKLDVLKGFASGSFGPVVALIDIDAVVLRPFALERDDALYAYDIAAHTLPAYGASRVGRDLAAVLGRPVQAPRWFGGEFIAGHSSAFAPLAQQIERLWPRYLTGIAGYHHVGDEMVLTAALTELSDRGAGPVDAGAQRLVARWWSSRTQSPIEPLADALDCAVLHLPGDKDFLAGAACRAFDPAAFAAAYRDHARRARRVAMAKNIADLARLRPPQHLPRIAADAAYR